MKRFISGILLLSVFLMSMSQIGVVVYAEADGTEANPYIISSYQEFVDIPATNDCAGVYYELQNDIVLESDYVPFSFYGNLIGAEKADGTKYKITMNITKTANYSALFTELFGIVKNIQFEGTVEGLRLVATVAGDMLEGSLIENCISNVTVTATDRMSGGFAGQMLAGSEIRNSVFGGKISGTTHVGGIVGYINGGTVSGCSTETGSEVKATTNLIGGIAGYGTSAVITGSTNRASVSSPGAASTGSTGGILGYTDTAAGTVVSGCVNYGAVSLTDASAKFVAGIIGDLRDSTATVTLCANHGTVNAAGNGAAGIVGYNVGADITKCVNTGDVSALSYAAGIVYDMRGGTLSDCMNTGTISGTSNGVAAGIISSGATGVSVEQNLNSGTIISARTDRIFAIGEYAAKSSFTNNVYTTPASAYANIISGTSEITDSEWGEMISNNELPTGFSAEVWEYVPLSDTNTYSLPQIKNNYCSDVDYQIVYIDDTTNYAGGDGSADRPYIIETAEHFANIVKNPSAYFIVNNNLEISEPVTTFSGTLDGNNKTVVLNISKEADRVGLFGTITGDAIICNLTLSGNVSGKNNVGALVGIAEGTTKNTSKIENITSSVTVAGTGSNVGGIIGANNSSGSAGYTAIINCHNSGNVTGSNYVGGIVGTNYHTATSCSNTGNINGGNSGGIAGIAYGFITNSYNTGTIRSNSGTVASGGIAGTVRNAVAYIDACYNLGIIAAPLAAGITSSTAHTNSAVKISNSFNAGAVLRDDGTQPVYNLMVEGLTATIENVSYLTKAAYDDNDANTTNITTLEELEGLSITGFTSGGNYPVITANPQETLDSFITVTTKSNDNGTANLFWYGPFIDIYAKSGSEIEVCATANEGYTASIYLNDAPCRENLDDSQKHTYKTSALTEDAVIEIVFEKKPAVAQEDVKITTAVTVFVPKIIEAGSEYTIKYQDGEYTLKSGVRYGATLSVIDEYYGWNIVEYGVEVNGVKYPAKASLDSSNRYVVLFEGITGESDVRTYAVYQEAENTDNNLTVYSEAAVMSAAG